MLLPLFIFALFGYGVVTLEKATDHGKLPITYAAVKEEIDADLDDLEEAYKESKAVYAFND
jgi:hypothetical protein